MKKEKYQTYIVELTENDAKQMRDDFGFKLRKLKKVKEAKEK